MTINNTIKKIGRRINPGYDYLELIEAQGKDIYAISEIDRINKLLKEEKDLISHGLLEERVNELHASHEKETLDFQIFRNGMYSAFASPLLATSFDNELMGWGVAATAVICYVYGMAKSSEEAKHMNLGYRKQDRKQRR